VRKGTTVVWRWEELHAERVQTVKRLIDQTPMPLFEIDFAAGFRSRWRFNDTFRATYLRPPSCFLRATTAVY